MSPQAVRRTLAILPFNAQCQSHSAYFDHSIFHFDEKVRTRTATRQVDLL